ncbi:MAG: 1,4-alpha-glucan branching protein GlgB [Deltaproteobacteria bacterium]|nr:1,4-alpha-glucan branching protein GlgB [Deltaproteobacteria bacterium]
MSSTLSIEQIANLTAGNLADPFSILGPHYENDHLVIRGFIPGAKSVSIRDLVTDSTSKSVRVQRNGLFELFFPPGTMIKPYRLEVEFRKGNRSSFYDCYSFMPIISEFDMYLYGQGNHFNIYDKLGAHIITHQGVKGTLFAVWAPSAKRVSVIGDFNQWDGRRHMMRNRGSSGIWELFVPHLGQDLLYKFEIRTSEDVLLTKADPFAFRFEERPKTAAVVHDLECYTWNDESWMTERRNKNPLDKPMSIYEVHLGSWRRRPEEENRWLTYREATEELIPYVKSMGYDHIELLPVSEHPFDGSWGYQVTGYYAVTSRFGRPEEFMAFVDRCHCEGIGVILDWVPAHFPKDSYALEFFDGTHLYEHEDPRQGIHKDWDTLIFNYGRNEVKNFLVANALFWLEKYHIDGLRVDAVASMLYLDYSRNEGEWVPNKYGGRENLDAIEFIKTLNKKIYELFPGVVTIAEESTAWPGVTLPVHLGGLGFMFKWNMGWMHDMLTFISKDPVHRKYHMESLTFALLYAFHENFILPISHDEVVHGKASLISKMPGDDWQKFANLRLLLGYMYGEPGKKMLFMGSEIGQWREWDHDQSLEWHLLQYENHQKILDFVRELNRVYHQEPAMHEVDFSFEGFEWIDFRDAESSVVSFLRRDKKGGILLFVFNFTPSPRENYRIGAPVNGFYREIMNSDSRNFGGSDIGLKGGILSDNVEWHGRPFSLNLTIPPLAMLILKPE